MRRWRPDNPYPRGGPRARCACVGCPECSGDPDGCWEAAGDTMLSEWEPLCWRCDPVAQRARAQRALELQEEQRRFARLEARTNFWRYTVRVLFWVGYVRWRQGGRPRLVG